MEVILRPIKIEDLDIVFQWRNHPEVRKNSFNKDEISRSEHFNYWKRRIGEAENYSFMAMADGKSIGLVRLDKRPDSYEVHVMVAPNLRGMGLGSKMIEKTKENAKKLGMNKLTARILPGNDSSQSIFRKNGFVGGPEEFYCTL